MPDKKRFLKNMAYASMVADGIDPIAAQQYLNGEYKEGIKTDTEASKRNAKAAAATLGVIGATAAAPAVFPVLMNPVTAKTAVGAGAATLLDAYGVTSGIKGLSGAFDKARYGSFKWRDVPELGLNLTTLIPGSSVLTTPKNMATAVRTANNIYQNGKLAVNTAKEVKDLRTFVPTTENKVIHFTPIPQKYVSTVHFDPRIKPMSRPISEFEKNGKYTLDELHQMGFKLPRKHLQGEDAVQMFKEYGTKYPETTRLYRITGTSGNFTPSPDGTAEFAGQWFSSDPTKGLLYGSRTAKEARKLGIENPIELQVVDIPNSQLERYRASNILKGRSDIEFEPTEDFLIPLDMTRGRAPMNFTGNALLDNKLELPNIPVQDTPLMQQLRRYVPEARERYGLVGNTNITDDEIAGSLYKKVLDLGGNTAARNEFGEPLVLFRGSTKRNLRLYPKGVGEQQMSGADNILGNLFLGELPGTREGQGLERYLGVVWDSNGVAEVVPPDTRAAAFTPQWAPWVKEYYPQSKVTYNPIDDNLQYLYEWDHPIYGTTKVYKVPAEDMEFGANDINGYVVRTPKVRDATEEISVLTNFSVPKEKQLGETLPLHYRKLIEQAEKEGQGLLVSYPRFKIEPGDRYNRFKDQITPMFRDEHENFTYYALPNFNINGAKHILPFDLRLPTQWNSRIVYRKQGGNI